MVPLFVNGNENENGDENDPEKEQSRRLLRLRFTSPRLSTPGDRAAGWLLTISWSKFLGIIGGFYLLAGALFATIFRLVGGLGANQSTSFADSFFMSLQALTVFGCGRLTPLTSAAKGLAVSAIFVGWLALLLVLAMIMVRFIRLRPAWRAEGRIPLPLLEDHSATEAPPIRDRAPN